MPGIDANTVLYLPMNGADGSTTFTDLSLSPKTVTANGSAQIDTAQFKLGTASGLFNGNSSNDYLTIPDHSSFNIAAADFTLEAFVRSAAVSNWASDRGAIIGQGDGSNSWVFGMRDPAGTIWLNGATGGTAIDVRASGLTFANNTWYHVAIVRASGVITIYLDGIGQTNTTNTNPSGTLVNMTGSVVIGNQNVNTPGINNSFNGWIDNLRWSDVARYTSNFTPPTKEYNTNPSDGYLFQPVLIG